MNEKNRTEEMNELDREQMETINAGKIDNDGIKWFDVQEPICKYCGCELRNVGGMSYKCFNDDCENFGNVVYFRNAF